MSCGRGLSFRLAHAVRANLCQRPGYWTAPAVGWQTGSRSQLLKLIHTTVVTTKKKAQASRQESYTEDFIRKQIEEFNLGKRHLANMMGEDPETFTEEDIDVSTVNCMGSDSRAAVLGTLYKPLGSAAFTSGYQNEGRHLYCDKLEAYLFFPFLSESSRCLSNF